MCRNRPCPILPFDERTQALLDGFLLQIAADDDIDMALLQQRPMRFDDLFQRHTVDALTFAQRGDGQRFSFSGQLQSLRDSILRCVIPHALELCVQDPLCLLQTFLIQQRPRDHLPKKRDSLCQILLAVMRKAGMHHLHAQFQHL